MGHFEQSFNIFLLFLCYIAQFGGKKQKRAVSNSSLLFSLLNCLFHVDDFTLEVNLAHSQSALSFLLSERLTSAAGIESAFAAFFFEDFA